MIKGLMLIGAINGFLAVALGAFGAHGLEGRLSQKLLDTWDKAVLYQMFHTIAIFAAGIMALKTGLTTYSTAGWFFFAGIVIFSGSLFVYSLTEMRGFAMITPIGGVAFLIGWIILGYAIIKII